MFDPCEINLGKAQQLIDILRGDTSFITNRINKITDDLNNTVYSNFDDILNAIEAIENEANKFPNYLNRLDNTAEALERFDNDLKKFKEMIKNCPNYKLIPLMSLLDLGLDFPANVLDGPLTSYSEFRKRVDELVGFPLSFLSASKQEILDARRRELEGVAAINEIATAAALDLLKSLMDNRIVKLAQEIEATLTCLQQAGCTVFTDMTNDYENLMSSIPLNPQFESNPVGKLRVGKNYKISAASIIDTSDATTEQKNNTMLVTASFSNAMNISRLKSSGF